MNTPHLKGLRIARQSRLSRKFHFEQLEHRHLLASWYASPTGVATNAGTINSPWDLQTALLALNTVDGGDTIYLRGGTYRHPDRTPGAKGYLVHLEGDPNAPITVRPYQSEHVIVDGGIQSKDVTVSKHVVIRELEVIVSENLTQSRVSAYASSLAPDLLRPWGGIDFRTGHDIQLINNVVHANMQGIGMWGKVTDSQAYGNLIYDNGWVGPDRGHGHGVYTQNEPNSDKIFRDNIIFGNWGAPFHAYGSAISFTENYLFERNFVYAFNGRTGDLIFGGDNPTSSNNFVVRDNVIDRSKLLLGYMGEGGTGLVVTDNTIWHGNLQVKAQFENPVVEDNFVWENVNLPPANGDPIPTAPRVFLNPSAYDSNRANLAIMNFTNVASVQVNVASFLNPGDTYSLQRPEDFYGAPKLGGTYTGGGTISVPVSGDFAAFAVVKSSTNTAPTISDITDLSLTVGTPVPLRTFTVGDAQTAATSLLVSATSDNPALTPAGGLVFGGSGASRTLQITPTAGAVGTSLITVQVRDAGGLVSTDTMRLTVSPVSNTRPTISNITNMTLTLGTPVPLRSFTIGDAESPANMLILSATSDNPALTPTSGLVFGGSGANRTLQIRPAVGATGTSFITVRVIDPEGRSSRDIIRITISPGAAAPLFATSLRKQDSLPENQQKATAFESDVLMQANAADATFEHLSRNSNLLRIARLPRGFRLS